MGGQGLTAGRAGTKHSTVLLDTNAVLWLVSAPEEISLTARDILADAGTELYVSAASAWEIAIKTRLRRLDGEPLLSGWAEIMADMTATELSIEAADAKS